MTTPPDTTIWQADIVVPNARVSAIEAGLDAVEDLAEHGIYGRFEEGKADTRFEIYITGKPPVELAKALEAAVGQALSFAPVPDEDWITRSNRALSPFHAGRFYITPHKPARRGHNTLFVPAGLAFGTGAHETTHGCLRLIDRVMRNWTPARAIDVGCGTGILAMAMVKAGARDVMASDNDPDAVTVTRDNRALNRIPKAAIRTCLAAGFRHPALAGTYDLIVANILARPLVELAPEIERHLAPGGRVILSGLLVRQEREVLAAYSLVGLYRRQHCRLGEWSALLLTR